MSREKLSSEVVNGEHYAVYLVRSGRICVAGLNSKNVEPVAVAMAAVLG